jgi:hypothetical protein
LSVLVREIGVCVLVDPVRFVLWTARQVTRGWRG